MPHCGNCARDHLKDCFKPCPSYPATNPTKIQLHKSQQHLKKLSMHSLTTSKPFLFFKVFWTPCISLGICFLLQTGLVHSAVVFSSMFGSNSSVIVESDRQFLHKHFSVKKPHPYDRCNTKRSSKEVRQCCQFSFDHFFFGRTLFRL